MSRLVYKEVGGKRFPFSDIFQTDPFYSEHDREVRMQQHLDDFFWKCFFMLRMNQVQGDYVEFGCGSNVRSFRLALKHNRQEPFRRHLYAFDSFQGLPEPSSIDVHPQWRKGQMAVSRSQFQDLLAHYNAEEGRDYRSIPGFFAETLGGHQPADYGIGTVAFAHIDADLYSSTVEALRFVLPVMADGGVVSFDDWFCFNASPDLGEQKAFRDMAETFPALTFSPYLPFGWHGQSFVVHRATSKNEP